jgi:integrase
MAKRKIDEAGKITIANKNANGEGTYYVIKSGPRKGLHVFQYPTGAKYPNGKPKRKTFTGKTKHEAKKKRDIWLDAHKKGLKMEIADHTNFGEYVLNFLDLYKKAEVSLGTYESMRDDAENHVIPALGDYYIPDLDSDTLQDFYNNLKNKRTGQPLSRGTKKNIRKVVNQTLEHAIEDRLIGFNPNKATRQEPDRIKKGKAMPDDSLDKFLEQVEKQADRWRAFFYVLLGTGLREGEAGALDWPDVDLEKDYEIDVNKTLTYTKEKGLDIGPPKKEASYGKVPLPEIAIETLKKHRISQLEWALKKGQKFQNKTPDGHPIHVFASLTGTYLWPQNMRKKFNQMLTKAGIPHVTLHSLRHTFATKLIEEGEDIRVVQALMRHGDIRTTAKTYADVTPKAMKRGSNRMNNVLQRKPVN